MRQTTVELERLRDEIAESRPGRFEAVPDGTRHIVLDLIDEVLELRDRASAWEDRDS